MDGKGGGRFKMAEYYDIYIFSIHISLNLIEK